MASKVINLQEEHILKLILEFLISRKHYKPARSLEKETRVKTNAYSENISFFRDLVLDGDWAAVKEFGEPLADVLGFEYCKFNFLVVKQEYLEILFEKCEGNTITDEQALRDKLLACLQNLERYCVCKEEYNKLYWYLSVSSLRSEPEFYNWTVDSSRMQLFEEMLELLKQFIPVGEPNSEKKHFEPEDRLSVLLLKGTLYENCIEFCQRQAMGHTGAANFLADVTVDLFRKQSLKSAGNFYSWLHSLSNKSFAEPFEELNFDIQVSKYEQNGVVAEVKNNSLSQSLTIELTSPANALFQRGRFERSKRLSDCPTFKPALLDFNIKDVSQSFAEFDFLKNNHDQCSLGKCPNFNQNSSSNDQEVFLQHDEITAHVSTNHASPNNSTESSTKTICDQQKDLVLQQLEEHKQLQQKLCEQLAESASLAKLSNGVKDVWTNDCIPDKSARSLKAVKSSIQNLKLLTESFESPKDTASDTSVLRNVVKKVNHDRPNSPKSFQQGSCPGRINITSEIQERKSSSSTLASTALPKTPVNTYWPPGMVNLTDGSGAFYSSTPISGHQTFTTPLPTSPVTSEQKSHRHDVPPWQSQQLQVGNSKPDFKGETPKTSGARQFAVRKSLVNTVFQSDNYTRSNSETARAFQAKTSSALDANVNSSERYVKTESDFAEERLKNETYNTVVHKNDAMVETHNSIGLTDSKGLTLHPVVKTTHGSMTTAMPGLNKNECMFNESLNFKKSAILVDTQAIRAVAFHPKGSCFAIGTNSKALKICRKNPQSRRCERSGENTPKLEVLCQKMSIHKGSVYCVGFSPNGNIIATGSNDKTIKLLRFKEDNPTNLEDQMELSIHNATVRDLTFVVTAGNPVLASGGAGGGLIHLSDCQTGQTLSSLQGHAGNIMSVFACDQAHLVCSGSADKTVRLWDVRVAKCIDVVASSSCVTSACFDYTTRHSMLLATADDNGQCLVYDVGARKSITSFTPHEMDCRSIRFSPDSQHILTGSYDASVAITRVEYKSSMLISKSYVVARHADKVIQCRWHPSEYSFLSTSADKTVVLWQDPSKS